MCVSVCVCVCVCVCACTQTNKEETDRQTNRETEKEKIKDRVVTLTWFTASGVDVVVLGDGQTAVVAGFLVKATVTRQLLCAVG